MESQASFQDLSGTNPRPTLEKALDQPEFFLMFHGDSILVHKDNLLIAINCQ